MLQATLSLFLLSAVCGIARAVNPNEEYTVGNFVYHKDYSASVETGEAKLIGVREGYSPGATLTFPATVMIGGKSYKVTRIGTPINGDKYMGIPVVFKDYPEITRVVIPATVERIGEFEFEGCNNITEFEVKNGNPYYKSIDGALYHRTFTDSNEWGLARYPSGKKSGGWTLPSEIAYIGNCAFMGNSALKTLRLIGDQMITGTLAFYGNKGISAIDVSQSDKYTNSPNGIVHDGLRVIACPPRLKLDSYTVPTNIKGMRNGAFLNTIIPQITLHAHISLGHYAMAWSKIQKITYWPEADPNFTHIDLGAFANCRDLEEVILKSSKDVALTIQRYAFWGCDRLSSLTIQSQALTLESGAFQGCKSLTAFPMSSINEIDDYYEDDDGIFKNSGLTSVNWPSAITAIPPYCFQGCKNLTSVNLNPSDKGTLKQIGRYAFANTGLETLNTQSVESIDPWAFDGCNSLRKVIFPEIDNSQKELKLYTYSFSFTKNTMVYVNNKDIRWPMWSSYINGAVATYYNADRDPKDFVDDWKQLYVPANATANYRKLNPTKPITEMFSMSIDKERSRVTLTRNDCFTANDLQFNSVTCHGVTLARDGSTWTLVPPTSSAQFDIWVNYTLHGVKMSTFYPAEQLTSTGNVDVDRSPAIARDGDTLRFADGLPWAIHSVSGVTVLTGDTPTADLSSLAAGVYVARCGASTLKFVK